MRSLINKGESGINLEAPGRMDVVEQVLRAEPFFKPKMRGPVRCRRTNRRGIRKQYSGLTVELVGRLARAGLDAVTMRRDELIAAAYQLCQPVSDGQETLSVNA